MSPHLRLDVAGDRATITLDRPDKRNMLGRADLAELEALLADVDADARVRVVVVTGAGDAAFSAGFAHGEVVETDWRDNPIERLCARLEGVAQPTVCALNGAAYGAAADLALACDLRLGVPEVRVAMPAAGLGVFYNLGGLRRFHARLGAGPARRLLLAGETLDAAELMRIGYLDRVVARDALARETDALAARLAGLAPRAVQGMKRALVGIEHGTLDAAWAEAEILACFASDDLREGLAAFAERRRPSFTGR